MLANAALEVRPESETPSHRSLPVAVAASRRDVLTALRLVYESYTETGLIDPNDSGCRVLPQHTLPTTDVLVARCRGEVASTLSLVRDSEYGLPLEAVFPEAVEMRRDQNARFAEVSCLADRRSERHRSSGLLSSLMAFTAQFAVHTHIDELLITVHPRHAKFYQRRLGFESVSDSVRDYDAVRGNPAVLLSLDLPALQAAATPAHRRLFVEHVFGLHAMRRPRYSEGLLCELAEMVEEQWGPLYASDAITDWRLSEPVYDEQWGADYAPKGAADWCLSEPVILPFGTPCLMAG